MLSGQKQIAKSHPFLLLPAKTKAPKLRIDGTQIPTKIPCDSEPVNHRYTDRRNDKKAAAKIDPFAILILELMLFSLLMNSSIVTNWYIVAVQKATIIDSGLDDPPICAVLTTDVWCCLIRSEGRVHHRPLPDAVYQGEENQQQE